MPGVRWLETDSLSNQNISSALEIGSYTADADRAIMVQAFADAVAGNGDYVMYVTLQIGGSGSAYVLLPKTTMAAASGETAIGGQSGWINVRNADVVKVYIYGLAGDTTTPDTIVRWFEDASLQPTTADRTLDVTATGEAGIDWANIGGPTTTVNLSGTTVKTATDVETDTADIQGRLPAALVSGRIDSSVGAMATDTMTAAALKADAVTEIQSGLATAASIAALNNLSAAQVNAEVVDALTVDVIADSVAADGSRPTIAQALLELTRFLMERSVSSTTMTVKKEDGTTASMTFTLDSATAPTAITRAT